MAERLLRHGFSNDAARDAYLAAYHAAQAYLVDHAGRAAKIALADASRDGDRLDAPLFPHNRLVPTPPLAFRTVHMLP